VPGLAAASLESYKRKHEILGRFFLEVSSQLASQPASHSALKTAHFVSKMLMGHGFYTYFVSKLHRNRGFVALSMKKISLSWRSPTSQKTLHFVGKMLMGRGFYKYFVSKLHIKR